jgi:hypothetical protein
MAREPVRLLSWDDHDWLYLLNQSGDLQAQAHSSGPLTMACAADDGSAYAAAGHRGEIWWLAPDLSTKWTQVAPRRVTATAMDPFGQYLAVADAGSDVQVFDLHGQCVVRLKSQRPLSHLAFVPAAPFLIGASDYGLVACFDLTGRWVWRDGLVAHVGSISVSGDGKAIVLACFTDGLHSYTLAGKKKDPQPGPEPCTLASIAFDGQITAIAGLSDRLTVLNGDGTPLATHVLGQPAAALVLSALGDKAVIAFTDGTLAAFEITRG